MNENKSVTIIMCAFLAFSTLVMIIGTKLELEEEIPNYPDDYSIEVSECELKPIWDFSAENIAENVDNDRFSEDGNEEEYDKILKALNECVDFGKLNKSLPMMWYGTKKKFKFTKADMMDAIS